MYKSEVVELLKGVSIFSIMKYKELSALCDLLLEKSFPENTLVFNQEDPGDSLFVICSGRVKVVLYGEGGREVTLASFGKGDFFGEMSLLDDMPRSANVVTLEESCLLILKRNAFKRYLVKHPTTAITIMAELSRRLRRADEIIGNLALLDVFGRVARLFADLGDKNGEKTNEGFVIFDRPTHQDIANMVGTSRETISRTLNEFQKRRLLKIEGKKIVLQPRFFEDLD